MCSSLPEPLFKKGFFCLNRRIGNRVMWCPCFWLWFPSRQGKKSVTKQFPCHMYMYFLLILPKRTFRPKKKLDLHQAFSEGFLKTFTMHEHVLIVIFACMILDYHYRFTLCLKKQRTTIKNTFSKLRPSWFVRHPWFNGDHGVHSRCSCFRIFLSTKHKVLEVRLRKCEEESCKQFGNSLGRK